MNEKEYWIKEIDLVISDTELDKEFNILNIMLYGTVYYFNLSLFLFLF